MFYSLSTRYRIKQTVFLRISEHGDEGHCIRNKVYSFWAFHAIKLIKLRLDTAEPKLRKTQYKKTDENLEPPLSTVSSQLHFRPIGVWISTEWLLRSTTTVLCVLQGCLWMGPFLVGTVGWLALWWTRLKCLVWVEPSKQTRDVSLLLQYDVRCYLKVQRTSRRWTLPGEKQHYASLGRRAYLGADFGLVVTVAVVVASAAAAVAVVVCTGISILVYSVQEPEKEFQGIVLRVPSKLRAVLRHYTLKREKTLISHFGRNFWSHYMVALWQNGATMITWSSSFVSEKCFSWGH